MITASQKLKTPYCVTITNGVYFWFILTLQKNAAGKEKAFRPHEFLCAAYASLVFISLYANCWIKKNYLMNK